MARWTLGLALVLAVPAMAQEIPTPTESGTKALDALIRRCVEAGGLRESKGLLGIIPRRLSVADPGKLKAAVATDRAALTPELRDALVARAAGAESGGDEERAVLALLREVGASAGDGLAAAFADFYEALALENRDGPAAVGVYEGAARRFEGSASPTWQAACFSQIGHIRYARAEYRKAAEAFTRALEIYRAALGERHPKVAACYNNLGLVYRDQGDAAGAAENHARALEIRRAALGERHPKVAASYNNLALVYLDQGDLAGAAENHARALEILRAALGERHPDVASSYNNLALVYRDQGDLARAAENFARGLEIRRAALGERHPEVADSYGGLGLVYRDQGDLARAAENHAKALEIRRAVLGERHALVADSYSNLAAVYREQGDLARAAETHAKALEIRRAALGERHPEVADGYNNLANVYREQGDLTRAAENHAKALEIRRAALGERHRAVAGSYNNLGLVYRDQGDLAGAAENHARALEIFRAALGERHPDVASSYNNLANVYRDQGDLAGAAENHGRALEVFRAVLGERHPRVADGYNNLAAVYRDQRDLDRAVENFARALEIRRAALGERHPDVAGSYSNLANVYYARGESGPTMDALTKALEALTVPRPAEGASGGLRALPLAALVLTSRGSVRQEFPGPDPAASLRAALADYRAAAAVLDRLRDRVVTADASKLLQGEKLAELAPLTVGAAAKLAGIDGSPDAAAIAFEAAEGGSARLFVEQMGRSRATAAGRVGPALLAEEARLSAGVRQLDLQIDREQAKTSEKRDKDAVESLLIERRKADDEWRALADRMERESPQYAAMKYPRPCTIAAARDCLGAGEVALSFVPGEAASYLLVLTKRGDPAVIVQELPPSGRIAEMVAAMIQPRVLADDASARPRGAELYQALLGPAEAAIAGKALVIVPGGALGLLPFEILVGPDGRYLVEGHAIRYAPSLTALTLIRRWEAERPRADRGLWAMGDPVYDKADPRAGKPSGTTEPSRDLVAARRLTRGDGFARLPGAGAEVERVAATMGARSDERLLGPEATEAAAKRLSADGTLARYRYVHFACHGVLGTGANAQPGLVLSLVGDPAGEDGYLRLDEVTGFHLNADLVALSACQTGQGKVYKAEGVSGLARAFLSAGSRGVLCSLWQVEDASTADLMADLYSGLKSGAPAAVALRRAQLRMIESGEPPLHWAPFVLIGR